MTMNDVFWAMVLITILLLAGKLLRANVKLFQNLYLPSSILAGGIALLVGPEVLGRILAAVGGEDIRLVDGLFPASIMEIWSRLPSLLINVVFAALFIGKSIAPPREIWRDAGPMVVHGQIIAWGQYVVGLTLFLLLLGPIWGISPLSGALIEISFEGGHGTAAGLADTFVELGFESGADLALGLATIGVVAGVLIGTVLVNWAVRKGHLKAPGELSEEDREQIADHDEREKDDASTSGNRHMIDPLSVHLGYIGIAIGIGWILHQGLVGLEALTWGASGGMELMRHIPLFPLAMIGGVLLQLALDYSGLGKRVDRQLVNRVSGTALDVLIVSALATISLAAIGAQFGPFIVLAIAGILWNVAMFIWLAPRLFKKDWVSYGLANFGQCMGMTVIGLLLIRMTDPVNRTGAMHSFGYKQLLFEPVVGGGLFTAASLPLIAQFGPVPILIFTIVVMAGWIALGIAQFGLLSKPQS